MEKNIIIDDEFIEDLKKYNEIDGCRGALELFVKEANRQKTILDRIVIGNIFDCKESIICHQVNMFKVMGSGIAKQIRDRYPNVYNEYIRHDGVLGEVFLVPILEERTQEFSDGGAANYMYPSGRFIANMYSQNEYGYDGGQYTNYEAMRKCFSELYKYISQRAKTSLAIPYGIGCGLGGGVWEIVLEIIVEELKDIDFTIYKLKTNNQVHHY